MKRNLTTSLGLVQALGWATLVRSAALGFWTTVVMAILLIVGARAALRGRTWGLGLMLTASIAFPLVSMLGILVPNWFWLVGLAGAVPFALMVRPMARFDVSATVLFAGLATFAGVAGAFVWRTAAILQYYGFHGCH